LHSTPGHHYIPVLPQGSHPGETRGETDLLNSLPELKRAEIIRSVQNNFKSGLFWFGFCGLYLGSLLRLFFNNSDLLKEISDFNYQFDGDTICE
jgi:hypothetical protein